ncbi:MAG: J domain-containing protein [Pseudomonadota bacterium]
MTPERWAGAMFWTWNSVIHVIALQVALAFYFLIWPLLRHGLVWVAPKLGRLFSSEDWEDTSGSTKRKPYRGKWRDTEYQRAEPSDTSEWRKQRQRRASAAHPLAAQKVKHLRVLGLKEPAHLMDIKTAYRQLAKEYHPDRFASGQHDNTARMAAAARMRELNAAYDWLRSNA